MFEQKQKLFLCNILAPFPSTPQDKDLFYHARSRSQVVMRNTRCTLVCSPRKMISLLTF